MAFHNFFLHFFTGKEKWRREFLSAPILALVLTRSEIWKTAVIVVLFHWEGNVQQKRGISKLVLLCLFTGKDKQNKSLSNFIFFSLECFDDANLVTKTLFHFFTGKEKCYKWNFLKNLIKQFIATTMPRVSRSSIPLSLL